MAIPVIGDSKPMRGCEESQKIPLEFCKIIEFLRKHPQKHTKKGECDPLVFLTGATLTETLRMAFVCWTPNIRHLTYRETRPARTGATTIIKTKKKPNLVTW